MNSIQALPVTCLSDGVIFRMAWPYVLSLTAPSCREKKEEE